MLIAEWLSAELPSLSKEQNDFDQVPSSFSMQCILLLADIVDVIICVETTTFSKSVPRICDVRQSKGGRFDE